MSQVSRDIAEKADPRNSDEEMAPRNQPEESCQHSTNKNESDNIDDDDIAEIEAVNQSLDSLSSALDMIEEKTDGIKARLLELLSSNKEIRESIMAENAQNNDQNK